MSDDIIYTYMGILRPKADNANYATCGQLSPLFNDPYYLTIGLGTRIFLGGAQGYVDGLAPSIIRQLGEEKTGHLWSRVQPSW